MAHLGDKLTVGFGSVTTALDKIAATLLAQDQTLQSHTLTLASLTESRSTYRGIGRWIAGVASAVVVAAMLIWFRLK